MAESVWVTTLVSVPSCSLDLNANGMSESAVRHQRSILMETFAVQARRTRLIAHFCARLEKFLILRPQQFTLAHIRLEYSHRQGFQIALKVMLTVLLVFPEKAQIFIAETELVEVYLATTTAAPMNPKSCKHEGDIHPSGAQITKKCSKCTCDDGFWDCTMVPCSTREE